MVTPCVFRYTFHKEICVHTWYDICNCTILHRSKFMWYPDLSYLNNSRLGLIAKIFINYCKGNHIGC